jgi:hypothetical protein
MEKAKAIKRECCLRAIEGSRKPALAKDLNRFRQWEILASTVIDVDMMDAIQCENREPLGAAFRIRTDCSRMAELNAET